MRYILAAFAAVAGGTAVVSGGMDDAPGLQLIGVAFLGGAIVLGVRAARRASR